MSTKPGDIAKSAAKKRLGKRLGRIVPNPTLRIADLVLAMDREHAERLKLEKEVASLRRRLDQLLRTKT